MVKILDRNSSKTLAAVAGMKNEWSCKTNKSETLKKWYL